MNFQFSVLICLVILVGQISNDVVGQSKSISLGPKQEQITKPADVEAAKMNLKRAASHFSKLTRLAKRGSVSSFDLKEAEYEKQIAELELQSLQDPSLVAGNLVLMARLKVDLEKSHFEIAQRLYKSRSLSELKYRRQSYQLKSARIALKAATGEISTESANLLVARNQNELAKIELELAQKLRRRRSITQSTYQELLQRFQDSQRKVEELERLQQAKRDAIKQKTRT